MEILKVTFVSRVFYNAESEYFVGDVRRDGDKVISFDGFNIVGKVDRDDRFVSGLSYELSGKWVKHATYGKQFAFDGFVQSAPLSRSEVVTYLAKYGIGIGVKVANDIFDAHGEHSIAKLRSDPEAVASATKRLTKDKAIATSLVLQKLVGTEEVRARLMQIFAGRGIAATVCDRCLDEWGVEAPNVVRDRPYALLDARIKGVGFKIADRMYIDFGGDPAADDRTTRLLVYVLEESSTGSTWLPHSEVETVFYTNLTTSSAVFKDVVSRCDAAELIATHDGYICLWVDHLIENVGSSEAERLLTRAATTRRKFSQKKTVPKALDIVKKRRFK